MAESFPVGSRALTSGGLPCTVLAVHGDDRWVAVDEWPGSPFTTRTRLLRPLAQAPVECPAPGQLEAVADWLAGCEACGREHEYRWRTDDRRDGGTWAAVDGHWYESRDRDAARLLRAEAKRLREASDE